MAKWCGLTCPRPNGESKNCQAVMFKCRNPQLRLVGQHVIFFFLWRCGPTPARASSFLRFLDHTKRCNTVGRTHLYEPSAGRRDLYLTTCNNHNRQTSMPRWDSNPQSEQAIGRRPTQTARLLGPAPWVLENLI